MANVPIIDPPETVEELLARLRNKLRGIVPDAELNAKAEIAHRINKLKKEMNAVILGHNYMEPALYFSVPDFVGDSLQLSSISAETDADVILFCGVQFMAETAKVLNPDKTVLIPALEAGCSLAEGITCDDLLDLKQRFPGAPVVSYVNTYAETKALSDYGCTSGNSSAVVRRLLELGHKKILFIPDEFLARNTALELGMPFVEGWKPGSEEEARNLDSAIIGWKARCEVHELFTLDDIARARADYPQAVIIAHPECAPEVVAKCDVVGSTKKMVDYVKESEHEQFIFLTECSMGDNIAADNPDKQIVHLCNHQCPYMALITLEDTLAALENLRYQVELPGDIIQSAKKPIDRMLEIL